MHWNIQVSFLYIVLWNSWNVILFLQDKPHWVSGNTERQYVNVIVKHCDHFLPYHCQNTKIMSLFIETLDPAYQDKNPTIHTKSNGRSKFREILSSLGSCQKLLYLIRYPWYIIASLPAHKSELGLSSTEVTASCFLWSSPKGWAPTTGDNSKQGQLLGKKELVNTMRGRSRTWVPKPQTSNQLLSYWFWKFLLSQGGCNPRQANTHNQDHASHDCPVNEESIMLS